MGVAALWRCLLYLMDPERGRKVNAAEEELQPAVIVDEPARLAKPSRMAAIVAFVIGMVIPVQMVSQTWDDHDRSRRFAARDYAINYLESLEPNAIVFCNGDNDTFPRGMRRKWKACARMCASSISAILTLTGMPTRCCARLMTQPLWDFTATPKDYAYGKTDVTILARDCSGRSPEQPEDCVRGWRAQC